MSSTSGETDDATPTPAPAESRSRIAAEIWIVLLLTVLQSGLYAALRLLERYLDERPVGTQTATLNPQRSRVPDMELAYQVASIAFRLVPVALVLYLLSTHGRQWWRRLGLVGGWSAVPRDAVRGLALAAAIGLPGIGLYAVSRATGQGVRVDTSGLPEVWWAATVLLASAAVTGIYEEVIVAGYLLTRLRDLRWRMPSMLIVASLVRGSYHLYQGYPMALGNVVMGLVFSFVYLRTGRVGPLIMAHLTMDAVAFIGPEFAPQSWLDAIEGV